MKKMNRFVSMLALALSAAAVPQSGFALGGDIVEIRAVDVAGSMVFGNRNAGSPELCTMENPLIAGDEVYFRVRMLVRNYDRIHVSPFEAPQEWSFQPNTPSASFLNTPALGLFIGDRPVYATFSTTGPNWWQESGTLKCDDAGNTDGDKTVAYTHFTDLYFYYKVQAGDIGLPVVLMNSNRGKASSTDDNTDYFLLNCALTAGDTLSPWKLANTKGEPAVFHYGEETLPEAWPTGSTTGPVRNFDLAAEGVFIKTVDFDRVNAKGEPWTEGEVWRSVYPGMTDAPMTLPALSIPGGSKSEEANVVWIWSEDETVFEPVGNGIQVIDGHKKLPVTIPAGAETVTFTLRGADGAAVGSVTNIVMSSSRTRIVTPAGEEIGSTLKRLVQVVTAPEPTVKVFLDGTEPKKKVTASPDYTTCGTKLTLKMVPACSEDVTVTLKASVEGDSAMGSLEEIYDENIIRIAPDNYGGDPINQRITEVTIPKNTSTVNLDVFILGATAKTGNKGVYFETEKKSGPASVKTEGGCTLQIARGTPAIVDSEPPFLADDDDKTTITVKTGDTVDFTLELADTYRNLNDEETGYTFYWTCDSQGDIDPYEGVVMEDGLFTGSAEFYNVTGTEGDILSLYVKSPDGQKSKAVTYRLIVNDKPTTTIEFTEPRMTFCEGEQAYVNLGLWPTAYRKTGYIFLDADDKSKLDYVDSELKTEGALLPQGQLKVETPRLIRFRDGTKDLTLKAVLCSENDLSKPVTTYASGTLSFTVTNKPPTVVSAMAAGQYVTPDMGGKTLPDPISRGVVKTFTVVVDDVEDDLKATGDKAMAVKWMIDGTTYETNSIDNAGFAVKHTFANEKENALIQIFVKDKDMLDYPQVPNMSFYARIKDTPRVLIRTSAIGGKFLETDKSVSTITVELTEPATAPVRLRFKVSQVKDGGYLRIRTVEGSVEEATDEAGNVLPGEYDLLFDSGVLAKELVVSEMDGTNETLGGLDLNARVTSGELNPDGVAWSNFYTKAESALIRVQNVAPEIIRPTEAEAAYTNMNASANVPYPIPYGCNDVVADLATGIVVAVSIDGTVVFTTNVTSTAVGSYEATFEGEGAHVVEVSFTDKDQMISRRTLNYFVKPSKRLQLRAHGPAVALGTTGGYSMHYGAASGLGAGRVYAGEKGPQQVKNFVHLYSFAEVETAISAYAVGYRVGDIDNGGLEPFNDAAIDVDGNTYDAKKSAGHYDYANDMTYTRAGRLGFDSFLYGWACNNTESSNSQTQGAGGGTTSTTMSFLLNIGPYGETVIPLPETDGKNDNSKTTAYPMQYWEAVFSRELFKDDNCGDINLDGVPDIAVYRFGLGIVDTATYQLVAGGEGNAEGDLTDVSEFNKDVDKDGAEDPDYLPSTDTSAYAALIPGLRGTWASVGKPFGARLEIRGYHDGLNDALDQLGITGYRPASVYAEPVETAPGVTNWVWTKACTISELEFAAWSEFAAANGLGLNEWANADGSLRWSPERPTNPMKSDTDGDGFTDGYEYYFWYRAHVGYFDANGVHRRLTGRRYDERNPGEGTFITSEEIADLMDPLVKSGDASSAETRDTDNDGLPDLLEFEIGTNPFDFDTDGDGLPDGWELCNVGNLSPLDPATHLDGKSDTERNSDGDAMAISSYALEKQQKPVKLDFEHAKRTTFAVIDPNGDTDGVQWYAVKGAPASVAVGTATNDVWSFEADGRFFVSTEKPVLTAQGILAKTLAKGTAFVSAKPEQVITPIEEPEPDGPTETTNFVAAALYPVRLAAGTPVANLSEEAIGGVVTTLAEDIKEADANACWIYGKGPQNALYGEVAKTAADYGCLALGRQLAAKKGAVVCALPDDTRDVAFLHYLVYQEFGFDPRTAWKAKDPLAARWSKSIDGESVEGITQLKQGGYTGAPSRTRDYANYDEFLVYSFFYNNGCDMSGKTRITDKDATYLVKTWDAFTTNPQGPNEILPEAAEGETATQVKSYGRGTNGADTDFDGVPDGWELYVMAGPKKNGAYVFAHPYAGFATGLNPAEEMPESYFSPFLDFAKGTETSNQIYLGGEGNDDTLNEFKEFEGTDSIAYYAVAQKDGDLPYSTTVVHPATDPWKWFNKFFPTDPWAVDTDGDGVKDNEEKGAFAYGTPADDGKLWSIPGGGLNPCSVDTDLDGLPDGWELQFKPENYNNVYAGEFADYAKDETGAAVGNPLQGLTDGMDGTVKDAFSYPIEYADHTSGSTNVTTYVIADGFRQVVNRDYDRDGLDNWQEYLTGTMRCWRYDDPLSTWSYIPRELYFKHDEKADTWTFKPDYAALGVEDRNEFWYRTLVDRSSPLYNPGLVTDSSPAMYFSRVTNVWDCAYLDSVLSGKRPGAYYWFKDRIGADSLTDLWGEALLTVAGADTLQKPSRYASCSPIDPDSDHDGMDDYYELFHGMNPLLGKSGVRLAENGPCDLVYDAWTADGGDSFSAWGGPDGRKKPNFWQLDSAKAAQAKARESEGSNGYDFEVYPWLNGLADADPDGDILPNQEEALLPKLSKIAFHTDPTPVWMTDTSYSNSLTRMFFRLPARFEDAATGGATFTFGGETNKFSSFDGWLPAAGMVPAHFVGFIPDAWTLAAAGEMNWMYSFEENEGYDSDHDGISDFEEKEGLFRTATDPQDADSPRRRQAMYFQGPSKPSALQTMPFVDELYPTQRDYPDDIAFAQFSAECWVKPESLADSIVLERAIWTGLSSPADKEYMRKNFQLGIRTGADGRSYWFAKYDPVGTAGDTHEVVALSKSPADATKWTHLAATYDGANFILYVNGKESRTVKSEIPPSWGAGAIALTEDNQDFWFDREHELKAIIIGAGAKTQKDGAPDGTALDVTKGRGFDRYTGFFTGWIDEVRIWDGARTPAEIENEWDVRYTAELAAKNRSDFYDEWKTGKRRYEKDASGKDVTMLAELRFHWAFDSIFGAQNEEALAVSPHAFDGQRAKLSRPVGYAIPWWKAVLDGYGSLYDFGRADWVSWIPNTVAHLPRFDGTTLDSVYWCEDFEGAAAGTFRFARTAEPVSLWTQYVRHGVKFETEYQTTGSRHFEFNTGSHDNGTQFATLFRFAGRNLNQSGDDLLPLGGAYAKSCDAATDLWDGQGPSSNWEITGEDPDGDGLPKWWETYADENYRGALTPAGDIGWKTVLDYNGMAITAGEAYLRDLAKGSYMNEFGEAVIGDDNYRQVADEDANGIPDWWADIYGIRGESGLDDHDNDGLPNYVEYLLSEVFQFNVQFDPTVADSVREGIPDYFYRPEGCQLYVGEIFTDHDLVDDAWEDLYAAKEKLDPKAYASRLAWDAFADADQDGWSNRSENRYAKAVMPIVANKREHNTPADGLVADYPIPTIALKLSYNGNSQYDVSAAPIAVQVTTEPALERDPDATYLIGAAADKSAGTGTASDQTESASATEVARTRTIGKWSDRRVIGTLTPGNIKIDSIRLQNCYDPSSVTYSWKLLEGERAGQAKRGTRAEYDDDLRKYGETNVELLSMTTGYKDLQDLELRGDEKSVMATWFLTRTGDTLGTVNLVTGEFSLDLGVFRGWTVHDSTNENEHAAMEDQTFRIAYATNPSVGLPRELYLGEADTGHVKEGRNTIVAWAETITADGKWQVGEPYGIVRDVDISWRGTKAEIELSDMSPITPRIALAGGSSGESSKSASTGGSESSTDVANAVDESSDRGRTFDQVRDYIREYVPDIWGKREWLDNNRIIAASVAGDTFRGQRIRVVRWLINDVPVYLAGAEPRVIFDKTIETDVRDVLTEADFLVGNKTFDIDSDNLYKEVISWPGTSAALMGEEVTSMSYLIVVGDGDIGWEDEFATNTVVALPSVITRWFGEERVTPVAVAPGAQAEEIVQSANPTFKWTMDCPEEEGYTAFRIQVTNGLGKVVYDSDLQPVPPRNDKGQYVWSAPLFAGDKNLVDEEGSPVERVFENKRVYGWKVAMYNAKYSQESNAGYSSGSASFFMEVRTNGYDYGTANVAVRYFGPKSSYSKKNPVIRVRAYTSPDFTGIPVAAGYVAKPDDPANGLTAGTNAAPNCTVIGIPRGTYYLQAFIDSNANGVCDPWETQGYFCTRDGTTPEYLDPTAITFDSKVGTGDLAVIYLEDADTDADGLPDAWEYAEFGSLTAKGVELLSETKAGEFVVNRDLSGALNLQENAKVPTAGLAGEIRNTIAKLSSPAGVSAATGIDPANVEMTDGGLVVKSEVDPETLTIVGFAVDAAQNRVLLKVGAETTADVNAVVANLLNITVRKGAEVTVRVERAESPAGPWTVVPGVGGTVTVDRAGADIEVKLNGELPAQGFFRARIDE